MHTRAGVRGRLRGGQAYFGIRFYSGCVRSCFQCALNVEMNRYSNIQQQRGTVDYCFTFSDASSDPLTGSLRLVHTKGKRAGPAYEEVTHIFVKTWRGIECVGIGIYLNTTHCRPLLLLTAVAYWWMKSLIMFSHLNTCASVGNNVCPAFNASLACRDYLAGFPTACFFREAPRTHVVLEGPES